MSYLLGVDAGQTVTKAVLYDASGRAVGAARADTAATAPHPRWQERDMAAAWHDAAAAIARCVAEAGVPGSAIAAVGICGHNDGVYPVDAALAPVRPAILATDSRAYGYVIDFRASGVAERALPLTGQSPFAGSPAAVCAWLRDHEPATLARARWLLFAKDWFRLCLTGDVATDPTDASASFTAVATQEWSAEALALYGLGGLRSLLPPMLAPSAVAGRVHAAGAAATGLAVGTPVVTGAHDVDAAALGVGAVGAGAVSIVMGTFAINQVVSPRVRLDHRWQARSFLAPDRWLHMSTSPSSASNLDWAVRLLGPYRPDGRPDFGAAVSAGLAVDPAAAPLFLPFLFGSAHGTVGAAFAGLDGSHDRSALVRAVLDGVCFSHRTHLDALRSAFDLAGAGPARLCGGGSRSPRWGQLLADVVGLDLEVTDADEAGARGAAALAGIGIGWWRDLEEAAAATVRVARRHDAHPTPVLESRYRGYLDLVASLPAQHRPE
ncbi:MAG TPA: FGGY-family carbohydrate kinase [Asanoa sp.]